MYYRPMPFLLKPEPDAYSLCRPPARPRNGLDGNPTPAVVKHFAEMKPGELLVIYHTGDERQAVGTAAVVSVDASDPKVPKVMI